MNLIFPSDIMEIILSFANDNASINNFSQTCIRFNNIVYSCLIKEKIYTKQLLSCITCKKYSVNILPIMYLIWPQEGNMIIKHICSSTCRRNCVESHINSVLIFAVGFAKVKTP
jgi:hypothetical protein